MLWKTRALTRSNPNPRPGPSSSSDQSSISKSLPCPSLFLPTLSRRARGLHPISGPNPRIPNWVSHHLAFRGPRIWDPVPDRPPIRAASECQARPGSSVPLRWRARRTTLVWSPMAQTRRQHIYLTIALWRAAVVILSLPLIWRRVGFWVMNRVVVRCHRVFLASAAPARRILGREVTFTCTGRLDQTFIFCNFVAACFEWPLNVVCCNLSPFLDTFVMNVAREHVEVRVPFQIW